MKPPEQNLALAALRSAWAEAPDPADLPIEADRMEGGTRVRTFSWQELVERLERDVAGDAA